MWSLLAVEGRSRGHCAQSTVEVNEEMGWCGSEEPEPTRVTRNGKGLRYSWCCRKPHFQQGRDITWSVIERNHSAMEEMVLEGRSGHV